jgi:hypothetical protein
MCHCADCQVYHPRPLQVAIRHELVGLDAEQSKLRDRLKRIQKACARLLLKLVRFGSGNHEKDRP